MSIAVTSVPLFCTRGHLNRPRLKGAVKIAISTRLLWENLKWVPGKTPLKVKATCLMMTTSPLSANLSIQNMVTSTTCSITINHGQDALLFTYGVLGPELVAFSSDDITAKSE